MKKKYFIITAIAVLGASLLLGSAVTKYKGKGFIDQETKMHVNLLLENKEEYLTALSNCQKSTNINRSKKCKAVEIATKEYNNKMASYIDKRMLSYMLK